MSRRYRYFVTGTDTGVGKTCVSAAMLKIAADSGFGTLGLKPVAAGCEETPSGLRNEDALILSQVSTCKLAYEQVNPIALKEPVSPHLAAAKEGKHISVDRMLGFCRGATMHPHEFCIVEGAGGWRVPINARESMADFAKLLSYPVVLVVGLRLGCLNHALLTAEAIVRDGASIAGWVANIVDPEMDMLDGNIDTLKHRLPCPCLGVVPRLADADPSIISRFLDITCLTSDS